MGARVPQNPVAIATASGEASPVWAHVVNTALLCTINLLIGAATGQYYVTLAVTLLLVTCVLVPLGGYAVLIYDLVVPLVVVPAHWHIPHDGFVRWAIVAICVMALAGEALIRFVILGVNTPNQPVYLTRDERPALPRPATHPELPLRRPRPISATPHRTDQAPVSRRPRPANPRPAPGPTADDGDDAHTAFLDFDNLGPPFQGSE